MFMSSVYAAKRSSFATVVVRVPASGVVPEPACEEAPWNIPWPLYSKICIPSDPWLVEVVPVIVVSPPAAIL